jgi:glycosyltransferase involved in cell wall biosynthesis
MHFGFYIDEWRDGGVPAFINRAITCVSQSSDTVTLFLARPHPKREPAARDLYHRLKERLGERCVSLDLLAYPPEWRQAHLVESILRSKVDCLFVSQFLPVNEALRALSPHIPLVGIAHNDADYYYREYDAAKSFLHGEITVSETITRKCRNLLPPDQQDRVHYIPYGVNTGNLPLQTPSSCFHVIYCARLSPKQKRALDLPPIWKSFLQQGGKGQLSIIGVGSAMDELKHSFAEEIAGGFVKFLGQLEEKEVYRAMSSGDVILNVSNYEGLPQTVLEGASLGLWPVLSKIESGHQEITQRIGFGTLCPVGANAIFTRELLILASQLPDLRAKRSAIREQTLKCYSLQSCIEQYRQLAISLARGTSNKLPNLPTPYQPSFIERLQRLVLRAKYERHMR